MNTIKLFFLYAFVILSFSNANCNPHTNADTTKSIEINMQGNGYLYDATKSADESSLDEKGLINWTDDKAFARVYFYPKENGTFNIALKVKAANTSILNIRLDSTTQSYNINIKPSKDYTIIPVGNFIIKDAGYHFIQVKGVNKTGAQFPDIQSLIVSGSSAQNITYNTSEYRGAPATHLSYPIPKDSSISWFYSEIKVPVGVDAVNAYYMTNGFNGGYMGIQVNSPTERRFIFSIWSNYSTDNPKEIPADYAVRLIKKGKDVYADDFGNEGSGGHSHLVFNWKNGETYKLLVGAKSNGEHTIFTGYYYVPENKQWRLIAQWDKAKNEGKLLSGLYSFVENFGSNGNDYFKALYGNQWVCTTSGKWIELTKASFTTTASQLKHPVFDYGAGVENNWFYMYSGGFKQVSNINPHDMIERKPEGKAPDIIFSALPDK